MDVPASTAPPGAAAAAVEAGPIGCARGDRAHRARAGEPSRTGPHARGMTPGIPVAARMVARSTRAVAASVDRSINRGRAEDSEEADLVPAATLAEAVSAAA